MLREKAGILDNGEKKKNKKRRDDDDMKLIAGSSSMEGAVLPTTNGHINLFEDLEIVSFIPLYPFVALAHSQFRMPWLLL
jgi:hypothetical protein